MVIDNKQMLSDNKQAITDALKDNREELAKTLRQNREALNASIEQGKTALQASVEQSRSDRRAWIAPKNAYLTEDIAVGKKISLEVQYMNVGREPALDIRPIYTFKHVPASAFADNTFNGIIEADDICKGVKTAPGADVAYPDQPDGYKVIFGLPEGFVGQDLVSGDSAMVLEMCFAYSSGRTKASGGEETHHTSFCYFYRAGVSQSNRQMNICTAGNHAE